MRFRNLLHRIEGISDENLGSLGEVFTQLDDLEASAYYQISHDRLEVIERLVSLKDDNAKERVMQEHLYQHLWLLDPSWERATHTKRMEESIGKALDDADKLLTPEEKASRLDIRYSTTGNRHVIIELKRAERVLGTSELVTQIMKYRGGVAKVLESHGKVGDPLEFICVIGKPLRDWADPDGRKVSEETLKGSNTRVVMYDLLIENAQQAYQDYLDRQEEAGEIHRLITSISEEDIAALSPNPA